MTLNDPIASRDLEFVFAAGGRESVRVSIGTPVPADEPQMWWCPYTIEGTSIHKSFRMAGIDAIQALTLALAAIPAELDWLSQKHKGTFEFFGESGHSFSEILSQK